ncbi:hypothetical protein HOD88_00185 [archaeon]|jgi:hypothetical protein|nr:hypothetical protein [archaeon]
MYLENTSLEFKRKFILKFTKELIKESNKEYFLELEKIIEKQKLEKEKKEIEEKKIKEKIIEIEKPKIRQTFKQLPPSKIIRKSPLTSVEKIIIPNYPLPTNLQHLRPQIGKEEIDLEKLNPLVKDQMVKEIECNGPGKPIIVRGAMGTKNTSISLTKEEIEGIFESFSKATKIPIKEGVVKVVAGRLILSAIISELVNSKFIIKKMTPQMNQMRYSYARR